MPRKLKVYRTPIGFHDAYVATPTKKAAMEAWGSKPDLFQRGEAEEVTDARLTAEPLASPGKVIKRLRGSEAEQIAALPSEPRTKAKASPKKATEPKPRPSRDALAETEAALAEAEERHADQLRDLKSREEALARERRKIEREQKAELDRLTRGRDKAEQTYSAAVRRWQG